MDNQESLHDLPSWKTATFFKRSTKPISQQFCVESNKVTHEYSNEELILHDYRNRINTYEETLTNGKNWEFYKKIINPFELVYTQKKYDLFPDSVCSLKPLSRSYFKMIEMLDLLHFFESNPNHTIKTAHVCEGPGGFIEALFDEGNKNDKQISISVAMTLRSKQSRNIPGWKRAALFLKKNRNVKILYGEDQTGDIMKPENQQYFVDYAIHPQYGGKIDIFTADGGFDFSGDYMKQEQMVFPLLLSSTKIGLEVLKRGGVFILKIFDFYQKATLDLLYFLSFHFEEWTLYKPGMSRPCNPEHYFIGKGFVGCTEEVLDIMRLWCMIYDSGNTMESLLTMEYSDEFKETIAFLRGKSFKLQTQYLERVFEIIDKDNNEIIQSYLKQNEISSFEWCKRFHMPIYDHSCPVAEVSHNDQPISCL